MNKRHRVFIDEYVPRRWVQRGTGWRGRRGWVVKVPHGSLWLLLLPARGKEWLRKS
jgi:hypothetical protein